jgi:hypothetical protein
MLEHRLASLIASILVATNLPIVVVSGPFMLKPTLSRSLPDMVSQLKGLISTAPTHRVEVVLSSSSMQVFLE